MALEHVCMFENPLPVMDFEHTYMDFEHTYKHIATICALTKSWKTKHTRSSMTLRIQLKLQKSKENATPIEESAC